MSAGADQITVHLREDRRHIQDTDIAPLLLVTKEFGRPLNLEMGCADDIIEVAISSSPEWICLVPEKREEQTTEGGLDLTTNEVFARVEKTMATLRDALPEVKISLFLEAKADVLELAARLRPNAVEIHTGEYARMFNQDENVTNFVQTFQKAKKFLQEQGIAAHAGHGLTDRSTEALAKLGLFEEFNIGHWVVCQSVFEGIGSVTQRLKKILT